jgi:hypothetical protein
MKRSIPSLTVTLVLAAGLVHAEPMFLSRQYNRCTTCHYSPTGGGLLTPYGRSLTHQELSTHKPGYVTVPAGGPGEEAFLWGALGKTLDPVNLGIDVRPSHLHLDYGDGTMDRDLFMNADLMAAWRSHGWTVYGELGREPLPEGSKIDSYEYWVSHATEKGLGVRVGRFLPAYGVRLADHTAFTRTILGFDKYDQVYGLELSYSGQRHLVQLTLSPGRADSILHNDGLKAATAAGRFQLDLGPRTSLVVSGLVRGKSDLVPSNGATGLAFGFTPLHRLSMWTEVDARFQQGSPGSPGGTAYILLNETAYEIFRGLWLKFSPQLRTDLGDTSGGFSRMVFEADLLPRTHWNVDVSYYRDRDRLSDQVVKTLLAQLHLYL